jgi:hypothetical protein
MGKAWLIILASKAEKEKTSTSTMLAAYVVLFKPVALLIGEL